MKKSELRQIIREIITEDNQDKLLNQLYNNLKKTFKTATIKKDGIYVLIQRKDDPYQYWEIYPAGGEYQSTLPLKYNVNIMAGTIGNPKQLGRWHNLYNKHWTFEEIVKELKKDDYK